MAGRLDFSKQGRARVYFLTFAGTLFCIAVALAFDNFSFETMQWRWAAAPINDVLIPLILAPPFFWFLLTKLRELAIAHQELISLSATDSLTLVLNRRAFTAVVEGYLERLAVLQTRSDGALLVIDVDNFKSVNDTFGHHVGDEALRLIASTIQGAVREGDVVGRIGGEEFGVFLPGVSLDLTKDLSERIRQRVHQSHFAPNGRAYPLTVSLGGTAFSRKTSFGELYRTADERLYAAKHGGRNRVDIFDLELGAGKPMLA
ncbi:GGDEF domain-containing protein [Devosia sp.]